MGSHYQPILEIKGFIKESLEIIKRQSVKSIPNWKYDIKDGNGDDETYNILIRMGLKLTPVVRQSIVIPKDVSFAKMSELKLSLWHRVLVEAITLGLCSEYNIIEKINEV